VGVVERGVVVVNRRVFPPLLCAIVLGVMPWRFSFRFVSFRPIYRFAVYRFEPKSKITLIHAPTLLHSLDADPYTYFCRSPCCFCIQ